MTKDNCEEIICQTCNKRDDLEEEIELLNRQLNTLTAVITELQDNNKLTYQQILMAVISQSQR